VVAFPGRQECRSTVKRMFKTFYGVLARLAELAGTGRLRTVISQTFPLAQGRQAFESDAAARRPGKTVLVVR